MAETHGNRRTVKTAETVLEIIETLQETKGMGVTELADEVDLAPSTVHGHLTTLLQHDYAVKDGDTYKLGLKFAKLGREIRFDMDIVSAANPTLAELASDTNEEAWLTVVENGHSVPIMKESADKGIESVGMICTYTKIHDSAAGKAVLAHMPEERVREIIEEKSLPASTKHTITDAETLFEELERIREQGYALSRQERYDGVRGVFSPIIVGERVYGSIGVAGPSNRIAGDLFHEELPDRVMEASNEIELKLRYPKFNNNAE